MQGLEPLHFGSLNPRTDTLNHKTTALPTSLHPTIREAQNLPVKSLVSTTEGAALVGFMIFSPLYNDIPWNLSIDFYI